MEEKESNQSEKQLEKISNKENKETELTPEIFEKMEKNPMVREFFGMIKSGPSFPPFFQKIEGSHISKTLDIIDKEVKYDYKSKQSSKKYNCFYAIFGVAVFIFLTIYFVQTNNIDLLWEIIKIGSSLIAGGIGGYGLSEIKHNKNK